MAYTGIDVSIGECPTPAITGLHSDPITCFFNINWWRRIVCLPRTANNPFVDTATFLSEADWENAISSGDIALTPITYTGTQTPGAALTDESPNQELQIVGAENTNIELTWAGLPIENSRKLKQLFNQHTGDMQIFPILKSGKALGLQSGGTGLIKPFPVKACFFQDRSVTDTQTTDKSIANLTMEEGWIERSYAGFVATEFDISAFSLEI